MMRRLVGPMLRSTDEQTMTAMCRADIACIGFMYHPSFRAGKLMYSLNGDSSFKDETCSFCRDLLLLKQIYQSNNLWALFMDAGILASQSINIDDAGQSMAFCVDARCTCHNARYVNSLQ